MKKTIYTVLSSLVFFLIFQPVVAQENSDPDFEMKDMLYKKYKKEVWGYAKNKFDDLFLEFFTKQGDDNIVLTKEEYYTYTIKIALYSEKLGLLYRDQKATAQNSKKEWFAKSYQDYIAAKPKKTD